MEYNYIILLTPHNTNVTIVTENALVIQPNKQGTIGACTYTQISKQQSTKLTDMKKM